MVSLIGIALLFSGLLMFLSKIGTLFGWLSLLAAVIGFVIFYKRATTAEQPLVRLTILKIPPSFYFYVAFSLSILIVRYFLCLTKFCSNRPWKNAFVAGLVMLPGATVGAILAPLSGRVLDQYGAKNLYYLA